MGTNDQVSMRKNREQVVQDETLGKWYDGKEKESRKAKENKSSSREKWIGRQWRHPDGDIKHFLMFMMGPSVSNINLAPRTIREKIRTYNRLWFHQRRRGPREKRRSQKKDADAGKSIYR